MSTTIRSSRLVRLIVVLAAATSLAGAALATQDAEAASCEMRGTQTTYSCAEDPREDWRFNP